MLTIHDATPPIGETPPRPAPTGNPWPSRNPPPAAVTRIAEFLGIPCPLPRAPQGGEYSPGGVSGTVYWSGADGVMPTAEENARRQHPGWDRYREIYAQAIAAGLVTVVRLEDGYSHCRGDRVSRVLLIAVNEDGTRGAVLSNSLKVRALLTETEAEAFARRDAGGIPDVD